MTNSELNVLSDRILTAAFAVHTALGPGLLESAYKACLQYELQLQGLRVAVEVPVPLIYTGQKIADVGYRMDLLVENQVVIEVKALEAIAPVHKAQLLSYLRLANKRLGLLLNFNVEHLRDGITRRINGY